MIMLVSLLAQISWEKIEVICIDTLVSEYGVLF